MDAILEDMGYELEDEEIEDLQSHLPIEGEHVMVSSETLSALPINFQIYSWEKLLSQTVMLQPEVTCLLSKEFHLQS